MTKRTVILFTFDIVESNQSLRNHVKEMVFSDVFQVESYSKKRKSNTYLINFTHREKKYFLMTKVVMTHDFGVKKEIHIVELKTINNERLRQRSK
jgi:hypothetical protein